MPGRRAYTPAQKHNALVALMVSAHNDDGEWCPMFRSVSRTVNITDRTLRRWWSERDRGEDAALRLEASRAREAIAEAGARQWLEDRVADIREGVTWIVAAQHRATRPILDRDGQHIGDEPICQPHHLARAYKDAAEIIAITNKMLTTGGSRDTHTRLANLRRSLHRVMPDSLK